MAAIGLILSGCGRSMPEPMPTGQRSYESADPNGDFAPGNQTSPAVTHPSRDAAGSGEQTIVRMAPIPNPEESRHQSGPSAAAAGDTRHGYRPAPQIWHRSGAGMTASAAPARHIYKPAQPAPAPAYVPASPRMSLPAPATAPVSTATPTVAKPAPAAAATSATSSAVLPVLAKPADARLAALQMATTLPAQYGATLTVPAKLDAGEKGTVVLTLPSNLFSTIRTEASKLGLASAAQETYISATLSGSGYEIVPSGSQTARLIASEGPRFEWQITPSGGVRGPLRASIDASLEGEGRAQAYALALVEQKSALPTADAKASGLKVPGVGKIPVGLLVLLALVVGLVLLLARIARNREEARRREAARRRRESQL